MTAPSAEGPLAADAFRRFAEGECRGYCRFYEELALEVGGAPEVLALTRNALPGQRLPNLLFGAVRYLLLAGADHPLREHYALAARRGSEAPGQPAWPDFREFCLAHAGAIESLVGSRLVQTNEVARCTALYPAFSLLASLHPDTPLGLVELGCSAGLLLHADRYGYRYASGSGAVTTLGVPDAPLSLACDVRGEPAQALPADGPRVAARIGIDRAPVELRDDDAFLWLRALIWPDRPDREENLRSAAGIARSEPPELRKGDAGELLPAALGSVPDGVLPVVFHAAAWVYFPEATRRAVESALAEESRRRAVARVSLESAGGRIGILDVASWRDGTAHGLHRARAHLHGVWLDW